MIGPAPRRAAVLLLLGTWGGCTATRHGAEAPPSILIVVVDALRPDRLGCYGNARPTSPRLDALAARGLRFTRAYSATSWTKPAIPSLFTSLYPSQHGVLEGNAHARGGGLESDVLPEEAFTLAEALRDRGYRTGAFVHNAHLRPEFGLAQGFDTYEQVAEQAPALVGRLVDWVGADDTRPFFAYLHVLDVHWPYEPDAERLRALGAEPGTAEADRALREAVNQGLRTLAPAEVERLALEYDAEIRGVDAALGALFDRLAGRGVWRNLALVVTADHGEAFLEHGYLGHGRDLFEESVRVPLILRLPGDAHGGTVAERRVSVLDVMPTVLELAGMGVDPARLAGRSLFAADETEVFAEVRHGAEERLALWSGAFKLVRTIRDQAAEAPAALRAGRFDDPAELVGARIEVEGRPRAADGFEVEDIELDWPADHDDEIHAPIERVDPDRHRVALAGYTVELGDAVLSDAERKRIGFAELVPGRWVKVDGEAAGLRLAAEKLRLEGEREAVRIEGLIRSAAADEQGAIALEVAGRLVSVKRTRLARALEELVASSRETGAGRPQVSFELYDLVQDPGELVNLAGREGDRLRELRALLEARPAATRGLRLAPRPRVVLDAETTEALQALGYVQ